MRVLKTKTESRLAFTGRQVFVDDSRYSEDNESLLQSINQNINEAIYRSIHGQGIVYINDAFARMFGYDSIMEVLNSNAINLYEDRDERKKLGDELSENGFLSNREVHFRRKDGSVFLGSLNSIKVEGNDGLTYFDGAIRDITQEKEAEKQLKSQSEMQRVLIDISSNYINLPLDSIDATIESTLNQIGTFLEVDRIQIHHYDFAESRCTTSHEWCARGIQSVKAHATTVPFKSIREMMEKHLRGENLYVEDVDALIESPVKDKLRQMLTRSILTVPMMLENSCVGFVSIESIKSQRSYSLSEFSMIQLFSNMSVNITSRAQDQKRLHKLLETTSIQNQRLKDFSHITSHNIRASVANLIAINSLLQTESQDSKYLESLDHTVERLNTSINNLNRLLNFDNANELLEKKECDITLSINRVLRHNQQPIEQKGLKVNVNLEEGLITKAFPIYLDGIFHNIISNAIKYGTDSLNKEIQITGEYSPEATRITIKDFGRGIDLKRYSSKLFKAGVRFQADDCEGQGMGLFMTKYMVEALGGEINIESRLRNGTAFTISFPKA